MNPNIPDYFFKPTPIQMAVQDFYFILSDYPKLLRLVDRAKISDQLSKKYPGQFQVLPDELLNFFTAVLDSNLDEGRQSASTALRPEGSLKLIEEMLNKYPFTGKHLKGLTDKLCNLHGTKFWDTISELLPLKTLYDNLDRSKYSVEFEYDFEQSMEGDSPKNADLALVHHQSNSVFLIDVYSPGPLLKPGQGAVPPTEDEPPILMDFDIDHHGMKNWLVKKYNEKFSDYCQQNPNVRVSVFLSLIKNDHLKAGFTPVVLKNAIERIIDNNITKKPGFKYGLAFSAASNDRKNLDLLPLGEIL